MAVTFFTRNYKRALAFALSFDDKFITITKFEQISRGDLRRLLLSSTALIEYTIAVPGSVTSEDLSDNLYAAVSSGSLSESLTRSGLSGVIPDRPVITNISPTSSPTLSPSVSTYTSSDSKSAMKPGTVVIIGGTLGAMFGVLLLLLGCYVYIRGKRQKVYVVNVDMDDVDLDSDKGSEKTSQFESFQPYRLAFFGPEQTV